MTTSIRDISELSIDELHGVSGGDMALDIAVKAYLAMEKRVMEAVHPSPQPTITLHPQ